MGRILAIQDDPEYEQQLLATLNNPPGNFQIEVVHTLAEGLTRIEEFAPEVILTDLELADSSGVATFLRLRERTVGVPVIVLTDRDEEEIAAQVMEAGAQEYLVKSLIQPKLVLRCIQRPHTFPRFWQGARQPCLRNTPIRVLLYSLDRKLQILGPALGSEFDVSFETSRERVKELLFQQRADVLILDLAAGPAEPQIGFSEEIRGALVPVVVMTDDDSREVAVELLQRGVHNYCRKPPALSELKVVVRRAYEYARLERDLAHMSQQLGGSSAGCDQLIGSSARQQHVYDLIRRVAGLNAYVLITGESGTGKELIARAIHNLSERRRAPFVAVSCGAIPETLIEAELFGYEKGAFTGAVGSRKGYLEQAGQGTLFLDEIGELSAHTQVKLLRVLQERQFSRLGSSVVIPLQARMLFATHRNLAKMVEEGSFRLDLYYRVNVMGIKTPALRDHTEDIPTLARHFLDKYSQIYQKAVMRIAPAAMTLLVEYDWPGNVRELENVIQKAIILTDDDTIGPEHLPEDLQQPDLLGVGDALPSASFEEQLRDYKIKLAQRAVAECHGNKTLAARSLHISRTYLHRLIKECMEEEEDTDLV